MSRIVGAVLIAVGAFLVTLAPLLRFYVYGQIAVAPSDYFIIQHNSDNDATYFDVQSLKVRHHVKVTSTATIRGNVALSHGKTDVWDEFVSVATDGGTTVSYQQQRTAFNGHTGYAVNCCDAFIGSDRSAKQSGLVFKWPFFAKKRSYPFYDTSTKSTHPINYAGTTKLNGVTVYIYRQHIGPVQTDTEQIPGKLVGLKHEKGMVTAGLWYTNTRTYWVEPVTGAPVKVSENQLQQLKAPGAAGPGLTVFKADMQTTPHDEQHLLDLASSQSLELRLLHGIIPLISLIVGAIVIAVGALLATRGTLSPRRRTATAGSDPESHGLAHTGDTPTP